MLTKSAALGVEGVARACATPIHKAETAIPDFGPRPYNETASDGCRRMTRTSRFPIHRMHITAMLLPIAV